VIEGSIEELFTSINESNEYKEYQDIVSLLKEDKEINDLIEEIKELEKYCAMLEYNNDVRYKEIDSIIKDKTNILNSNSRYRDYLDKLKKFNNALLCSSSLLQEYIDEKVSV